MLSTLTDIFNLSILLAFIPLEVISFDLLLMVSDTLSQELKSSDRGTTYIFIPKISIDRISSFSKVKGAAPFASRLISLTCGYS
jgi:hypothetical protein